jgi:tripartite-type tricarboxylate transporter receptor subunit TctC
VRIVVGFAPGGANDILARLIGQWLSERLGQPFVIENRPGGGSNIATEAVVRAPPDGYTLLLIGPPQAINATLYEKLNFNFLRDIAPVAAIIRAPNVMEVNPSVPAKTVSEFIAYAKANPGRVNMASAGNGTGPHMAGELFKMMAGVSMQHVPYRGASPALTDLIAGQVRCTRLCLGWGTLYASIRNRSQPSAVGVVELLGVTPISTPRVASKHHVLHYDWLSIALERRRHRVADAKAHWCCARPRVRVGVATQNGD